MTVCYTRDVATSRYFGSFLPLLFRWRGSIYKLVWLDLISFLSLYYALNLSYRFLLNDDQKVIFENVVRYCGNSSLIPISFILGFYVSIVMGRWWAQYLAIPWPDSIAVYVSAHIQGHDERGRLLRRTIMRYVCLCLTMVFTYVSFRVKKRFPTWDSLVEAGLLLENEKVIIDRLDMLFPAYPKHWLPIVWSASIVKRARKEGRIRDDFAVKTIIDELNKFRGSAGFVLFYDFISVPLVYTQVVTLAVYSYFIFQIVGSQYLGKMGSAGYSNIVDKYFPVFATLEFFFYMGWLKVAESLINPFGDDDDDFEVNWLIDRNLQVSYIIVDEMHNEHPELVRDQFWDEVFPSEIRYSVNLKIKRELPPEPSTAKVAVDYGTRHSTVNTPKPVSVYSLRSSHIKDGDKEPTAVKFKSLKEVDSSSSNNSRFSKQIGVVTPLNIIKPEEHLLPRTASSDVLDDFEALRREREAERLQRHTRYINRTVLDLHNVAESATIIQLLPTRPLVITDSERSFVSEMLFGQQEYIEPMAPSTSQSKPKVTISEPIKTRDKKKKGHERHKDHDEKSVPKLSSLALKAQKDTEKASTSRAAGSQVDKAIMATTLNPKQTKATATEMIYDSEGSISFSDAQNDENENDSKNKPKQDSFEKKNQDKDDSEASTLYSDASDGPTDYERPELFIDETADSDAATIFDDIANEMVSKTAADPTFADVEDETVSKNAADEGKEYYDSPEESDKDRKKSKQQDKSKKKR